MPANPICPKCDTEMREGFLTEAINCPLTFWVEGQPERGLFGRPSTSAERWRVATYGCPKCGYLESYRTNETW